MNSNLFTLLLLVAGIKPVLSQPTWSEDAAQVFYDNCTVCHNPNGIGSFSLMDYSNAFSYMSLIQNYVENNIMPPWKADSSFQHYFQERLLTQNERDIILDWVNGGGLEGDPALAPPPPVYNGDQILPGVPDLTIEMEPYMSKATASSDDYICISLPSGMLEDRKIKAMEVIPGNRSIVHHCLVFKDPAGTYVTDTIGGDCGGPSSGNLIGGYTPGSSPIIFPATPDFSTGMVLEAGSNVIFALHYPEGSYGEWDQTKVNFYFYPEPVNNFREVFAEPIIQDWSFTILANTTDSVEVSVNIPFNYTVLSVFPHMHLIGDFIESYVVTPSSDTVPLVRIPQWDFEWQDFYWFKYMQVVPAGSDLYGKGIWANLPGPNNPNDPPQDISAGFNTSDEMFLIYYHYMQYQSGDEFVNQDSLNTIFLSQQLYEGYEGSFNVYPNPFRDNVKIEYQLEKPAFVSVYIYDMNGKLVRRLVREQESADNHFIMWDGGDDEGLSVSPGLYFYSAMIDGAPFNGRIVKM